DGGGPGAGGRVPGVRPYRRADRRNRGGGTDAADRSRTVRDQPPLAVHFSVRRLSPDLGRHGNGRGRLHGDDRRAPRGAARVVPAGGAAMRPRTTPGARRGLAGALVLAAGPVGAPGALAQAPGAPADTLELGRLYDAAL